MTLVLLVPLLTLLALLGITQALPASQLPLTPPPHEHPSPIPSIDTWSLNSLGDAAIIRLTTHTSTPGRNEYELHLLAINAQYTIPSVLHGPAHPQAVYTFLDDHTLASRIPSSPSSHQTHPEKPKTYIWDLVVQKLNHTSLPSAYPPSLGPEKLHPKDWGQKERGEDEKKDNGPVVQVNLTIDADGEWSAKPELRYPLRTTGLIVTEAAIQGDILAPTALVSSLSGPSSATILSTLNTKFSQLTQISSIHHGAASSPAISSEGKIAWLIQPPTAGAQRQLWLADGEES
ncbi:hypothetical protein IAR50_003892 [Cryptococcus sp. DSM 104548]